MLTLSWVMIPWDWIGMVTIRSDTRRRTSMTGTIRVSPGSRTPMTRPRRNSTPFSYCWTIRTDSARPSTPSTTTTTTVVNAAISSPLRIYRCHRAQGFRSRVGAVAEQAQASEHDGGGLGPGRQQLAWDLPGVLVHVRQRAERPDIDVPVQQHRGQGAGANQQRGQPTAGPGPDQHHQPDGDRHGGLGPEQCP